MKDAFRVMRAHGLRRLLPGRKRWWLEAYGLGRWHYVCSDDFHHNVDSIRERFVSSPDELFEKYRPTTAGVVRALRALHGSIS